MWRYLASKFMGYPEPDPTTNQKQIPQVIIIEQQPDEKILKLRESIKGTLEAFNFYVNKNKEMYPKAQNALDRVSKDNFYRDDADEMDKLLKLAYGQADIYYNEIQNQLNKANLINDASGIKKIEELVDNLKNNFADNQDDCCATYYTSCAIYLAANMETSSTKFQDLQEISKYSNEIRKIILDGIRTPIVNKASVLINIIYYRMHIADYD